MSMKKNYTKPLLTVEYFSLKQSIARECNDSIPDSQLNFGDIANCVWDTGSLTVFVSRPTCDIPGEHMGYGCYNNPSEGNYVFRS